MFRLEISGNPAADKGLHIAPERVEMVRPHQSIFELFEKLLRKKWWRKFFFRRRRQTKYFNWTVSRDGHPGMLETKPTK
jgi:hypothetical protein